MKIIRTAARLLAYLIVGSVFLGVQSPFHAKALSDAQKKVFDSGIYYFNTETANCIPTNVNSSSQIASQLDLETIAKKYQLQSAIIKQVGGEIVASYKADDPPNSPASVLKLIIASTFLSNNPNLDKKVLVKADQLYKPPGGDSLEDPHKGQTISLRDTLEMTLMKSSNTGANILIAEAGGFKSITSKAHQLGYTSTEINAYFSDAATKVLNKTTSADLTGAMEDIFSHENDSYKVAQIALRNSTNNFGIGDSKANKWGGVSGVSTGKPATGNSALFDVGGQDYVITMYVNEPWADNASPSVGLIRGATNDILTALKVNINNSAAGGGCSSACSVPSGSLATFLQAMSHLETGGTGDPTTGNTISSASGKYQYLDDTWQSHAKSYYPPALQYVRAKDAPEAVQDALVYIEYAVKMDKYGGDVGKLAVSHIYPAVADSPEKWSTFRIAPNPTAQGYVDIVLENIRSGKASKIPLKFSEAPDFQSWYAKSVGRPYIGDSSTGGTATCGSGIPAGSFVFYEQSDSKWGSHAFGSSTIAESGCGPASVAMVVATLADKSITPVQTADFGTANGAYIPGSGSSHQKMLIEGPQNWGLKVKPLGTNLEEAAKVLRGGGLVIFSGSGKSPFSAGGHISVLRAIDANGKFLVGNSAPGLQSGPDQAFSAEELQAAGLEALFGVTK